MVIYRTVVEREGEWLGPVDWSTLPESGGGTWGDSVETLKKIEENPRGWRYSPSGFTSFEIIHVGMYDGWPHWVPRAAIGYIGPLGTIEVAHWYKLSRHDVVPSRVDAENVQTQTNANAEEAGS